MVTLAPGRWSLTRAVIAGILAWLLAFQGFAFAASPQKHFTPAGAGAGHVVSSGGDYCGIRAAAARKRHANMTIVNAASRARRMMSAGSRG